VVCAKAPGIGAEPTMSAAATAVAPDLRSQVAREAQVRCIVIRSK
jgi:hypothetical protein